MFGWLGLGLLAASTLWAAASERAQQAGQALALAAEQPQIAEAAMLGLLLQVQQAEPDLADEDWLRLLADYQPRIMRPHEHAAHVLQAMYPVDVMAKGQLNRLQRELRRLAGLELLDQPARLIAVYRAEGQWAVGYLDALAGASPGQAEGLRDALSALPLDRRNADLLGELALIVGDAAALVSALSVADPVRCAQWLEALQASKSALYPAALRAALARPELAPRASALQLQERKSGGSSERDALLAQLADPSQGAVAILPLARSLDREGVQALRQTLAGSSDPLLRRRLLLVLQSAPLAQPVLADLKQDPAFLDQLDQETRAWLLR
jgi:hypothetical protein